MEWPYEGFKYHTINFKREKAWRQKNKVILFLLLYVESYSDNSKYIYELRSLKTGKSSNFPKVKEPINDCGLVIHYTEHITELMFYHLEIVLLSNSRTLTYFELLDFEINK